MKRPPKCMTGVEFVDWTIANEWLAGTNEHASSPCADCTKDWHAQMLDEDKCDGLPGRQYNHRYTPEEKRAKRAAYARAYQLAHPEVGRAAVARYQAKKKAAA
jgi:hypothetical protein